MTNDEQYYFYLGRIREGEQTLRTIQDAYELRLQYVRGKIAGPQIVMDLVEQVSLEFIAVITNYKTTKAALDADNAEYLRLKALLGK